MLLNKKWSASNCTIMTQIQYSTITVEYEQVTKIQN